MQQPKLLRALEDKEVWPVGSDVPVKASARTVAATHRDLAQMVQEGRFREDLLFRLHVVNIPIPPLRERVEDIPVLVHHVLARFGRELGKAVGGVEREAMRRLMAHPWPGNVRELANVLEYALLVCESETLRVEDLPAELSLEAEVLPHNLREAVERVQHRHIASALERAGGNRELAAQALGLSSASLYRLMEKLGLKGYRCAVEPRSVRLCRVS